MTASRAAFLKQLIDPELMKKRLRFCAMYDAIVADAAELRVFEFHPKWRRGEQMGAFKNGSGDFFFAWFSPKGTVIRGFAHEKRAPQNVFDGLPPSLAYVTKEPASAQDEVTFALWNTGRGGWKSSKTLSPAPTRDGDGAEKLLGCFARNFEKWRKQHYGTPRALAMDVLWWEREPITRDVVHALNPNIVDLDAVREEAKRLAWPIALDETRKAPARAKKKQESFGAAEFVVRCDPSRVRMMIHGTKVVAEATVDVYGELFDLVKARILEAKREGA